MGARRFDLDEVWDPIEDQIALGFQYSKVGSSGFGIEFGVIGSAGFDDEAGLADDIMGGALEVFGGLRKEFSWGRWRPSFGVGAALIAAVIDNDAMGAIADDNDTTEGFYAHGGLIFDVSPNTFIGVDYRLLANTEIEFGTLEADADYQQVTFVLGVSF